VALQDAQLDFPIEYVACEESLLEVIAKVDIIRSTLESLHLGQEIELIELLDWHNSSNSLLH